MKENIQKLTLDRPATYQIKMPGHLDESWSDWAGGMTITVECGGDGQPVTILTGIMDQAALPASPALFPGLTVDFGQSG